MKTLIVSGGWLRPAFLREKWEELCPDLLIAADRGMDYALDAGLIPDLIVGDYDSAEGTSAAHFRESGVPFRTYPARKNYTDTEAAVREALGAGSTEILIFGATGGRLDHFLANLECLLIPLEAGVPCALIDEQNRITLRKEPFTVLRETAFGSYFSFFALGESVEDLTLAGFRYPLQGHTLRKGSSLCGSNELEEASGAVTFSRGILLMVESKDREEG